MPIRKKLCRGKTRSLAFCRSCSEAREDLRGCTIVVVFRALREKSARAPKPCCFLVRRKKFFVKEHATRATVEKCAFA